VAAILVAVLCSLAVPAAAAEPDAAIAGVVKTYFTALNTSDVETMASLYSDDGVFLQLFNPTAVGKPAVREAYDRLFKKEKMDLTYKVAEIVQMSPTWAYARTSTEGPLVIKATGVTIDQPTQDLFIFRKDGGQWRIVQFAFSPNDPPPRF